MTQLTTDILLAAIGLAFLFASAAILYAIMNP